MRFARDFSSWKGFHNIIRLCIITHTHTYKIPIIYSTINITYFKYHACKLKISSTFNWFTFEIYRSIARMCRINFLSFFYIFFECVIMSTQHQRKCKRMVIITIAPNQTTDIYMFNKFTHMCVRKVKIYRGIPCNTATTTKNIVNVPIINYGVDQ